MIRTQQIKIGFQLKYVELSCVYTLMPGNLKWLKRKHAGNTSREYNYMSVLCLVALSPFSH